MEVLKNGRPTWAFWSYAAQVWIGGLGGLGAGIAVAIAGFVVGWLLIACGAGLLIFGTVTIVRRLRWAKATGATIADTD